MLDHPPLSASPELDARIAARLDQVVELAHAELGDSLQTILLGGSLARGEAFGVDDEGTLRLLSDLDLYFVVKPGGSPAELPERIRVWAAADSFLVAPPDLAVVGPEYFSEARESMPTHQLAHAHRVLWGDAVQIKPARAGDGSASVDPEDAGQLLFNRFVESLDPALDDPHALAALVHRTKQFIDAPMAWLASIGEYSPNRRRQVERLRVICGNWAGPEKSRLEGFLQHWSGCLEARETGVVSRVSLERLARVDGDTLPEGVAWEDWTGGFAMAIAGGGLAELRRNLGAGLDRESLHHHLEGWLRREPFGPRLRRARRWGSVAPARVSPWWRHGFGGSGPDRIFAAACLRYHGLERWTEPVELLLRDPLNQPAELYALWREWIQGRSDEA
jgi:hypothetical protein